jgi:alpha-mannosidase
VRVFATSAHPGTLGKQFSFLKVDNPRIRLLALKKAEDSDEIVIRMVELDGKTASNVHVSFPSAVSSAREINAQEQPLGEATVTGGQLVTSFKGYQPRTFALRLTATSASAPAISSQAVPLSYTLPTATNDDTRAVAGGFDGKGNAYPAEMLSEKLTFDGVNFQLAHAATGAPNAVIADGQNISLPQGDFNRVYILAAANGDQTATFNLDRAASTLNIENWGGFIGQWDTRLWKTTPENWAISAQHAAWPPADMEKREAQRPSLKYPDDYIGLREGYIKPAPVAWYASHHHTEDGLNDPYAYSYIFAYALEMPAGGAKHLTLPKNGNIRVLAVSVAKSGGTTIPAHPLFDTLQHTSEPTTAASK